VDLPVPRRGTAKVHARFNAQAEGLGRRQLLLGPIDLGGRAVGATVSTGGTDAQRSVQTCRPAGSWATLPNALTPLSHRQSGKILSSKRRCPASEAALTSLGFNRSELP
jgi:hypothetical protein